MPTATAAVCSRNPTTTSSFEGGSRSTEPASNDDACNVGMSSWENSARITSRIASVATTRTMPRRVASCVASVDLPTPVAPPISTTSGTFNASISRQRSKFRAYRSPARSCRTPSASSPSCTLEMDGTPSSRSRSSIASAT